MINEFINNNSFVHRLNPTIKIVVFALLIIATFLPFGFTWQIVTLIIIHTFWFLGKLKWSTYRKTLITFIVMFLFLLVINWISYKDPGVSFVLSSNKIISPEWWWQNESFSNLGTFFSDEKGNYYLVGSIYGGSNVGGVSNITGMTNVIEQGKGFYSINLSDNEKAMDEIVRFLSNSGYKIVFGPLDSDQIRYFYVYKAEWYSISSYGITLALFISIKIFSTILIVNLLTSTTSPIELTYGFNEILHPLSYIKVPVNELAMILTLSIRFIPSLLEESSRVLKAQASRGFDIKRGNFLEKSKALISLLIPMFAISFRKSEELSNAMEARGYNPRVERTRYRNFKLKFWDYFVLFFIGIFFGVTLFFSLAHTFGNITFLLAPMGVFDAIILLM